MENITNRRQRATFESDVEATAPSWKESLARAVRDPAALLDILQLDEGLLAEAQRAAELFPLTVPREFIARMRPGDPGDPLLRQVLPLGLEHEAAPGSRKDPLAEQKFLSAPGLLKKYHGRALLVAAGTCAVNCRYCFRRNYPYEQTPAGMEAWEPAFRALENDDSIREVILSGGDPLVLTDHTLARLVERLDRIPHLQRLRIHSRLPIVIPSRVTDGLLSTLRTSRLAPVVVVHSNHPAELDTATGEALRRFINAGVPVLNQAVLLANINDDEDVLAELSERLVNLAAMPYYLHQLDPVTGSLHFRVPVERGLELIAALRRRLPGYAVPRYVQEIPGEAHKSDLTGLFPELEKEN
jgi:EF-P beta-lysylation protein EpmB